jgi:carboxylate-amine ligase
LHELLDFVASEIDELGIRREIEHVERILREGTGSDRQLETWARTRDMREVVDQIVRETYEGLSIEAPEPAPLV